MIAKDHTAKLTDFGIAHKIDPSKEQKPEEITGSPAYMPPEGFEKTSPFNKQSDIFSFGVVAYELLTGKKPFKGKNVPELLQDISTSKPTEPQKLNPEIPDNIQSLLAGMLNKKPEDRIQNMSEAIKILEKHLKPKTKSNNPKPQKFISRLINAASRAWS
jgi:serine/threonine-protein kinase